MGTSIYKCGYNCVRQHFEYIVFCIISVNGCLKVKPETKSASSCCKPSNTQCSHKPLLSKFEFGERSFMNGSYEQTPSPTESVCSSTSGKESGSTLSSAGSCSKESACFSPPADASCTYFSHTSRYWQTTVSVISVTCRFIFFSAFRENCHMWPSISIVYK